MSDKIHLLGYKIPAERFNKVGKTRGCHHVATSYLFCAECGAKMWESTEERNLWDGHLGRVRNPLPRLGRVRHRAGVRG